MTTFQMKTSDPVNACYYFQNIGRYTFGIPQEKLNTFHFCSPEEIAFKRKYPDSFPR